MRNEPEATSSGSEPSSHPRGYFDPHFRQGALRRAIIALCVLPALLLACFYVVTTFNRPSEIIFSILLAGLILLGVREVFCWWCWDFCPHCGSKVNLALCWRCGLWDARLLLRSPAGTFELERHNHDDSIVKLLSLALTLALRDRAEAFRIEGLTNETQIWSLHERQWVEWTPAPEGLGKPLVNAVHALAGLPQIQAGSQTGKLIVIDPTSEVHQCRIAAEIGPDVSRVELKFEVFTQATAAGGC